MTGHQNQGERPIKRAALALGLLASAASLLIVSAVAVGAEIPRQGACAAEVEAAGIDTLRGHDEDDVVETLRKGEMQLALYGNGLVCVPPAEQQSVAELRRAASVALATPAEPTAPPVTELQSQSLSEPVAEPEEIAETIDEPDETVEVAAPAPPQARSSSAVSPATDQYAAEMFQLINVERDKVGLAPLSRNSDLDQYAQQWAAEMSNVPLPLDRSRHHSPSFSGSTIPFRDFPSTIEWTYAFENVGRLGSTSGQLPDDAIARLFYADGGAGFTTSPTHYCNIVETAAFEVGVGTYLDSTGAIWVAQVFWGTSSPAPEPIASCETTVVR